jgi:hypothetical protein
MKSNDWTAICRADSGDLAAGGLDGVHLARLGACFAQAVGVTLVVLELQRVDRHFRESDVFPQAFIEQVLHARGRADLEMMVAMHADVLRSIEIPVENHAGTARALFPQIVRRVGFRAPKRFHFRADEVGDPVHSVALPTVN